MLGSMHRSGDKTILKKFHPCFFIFFVEEIVFTDNAQKFIFRNDRQMGDLKIIHELQSLCDTIRQSQLRNGIINKLQGSHYKSVYFFFNSLYRYNDNKNYRTVAGVIFNFERNPLNM